MELKQCQGAVVIVLLFLLLLSSHQIEEEKKDKKSLPYPGLKTNLFFVCCEVFAIAIQLLTKKNKIKKKATEKEW